jgi:hypothetical protein
MTRKICLISITLFLCLAACQVEPSPGSDSPTLEIITIQVTPASAHWMDKVAECSNQIPNFGVYRQILLVNELDLNNADLILRLGARQEKDPFVTVVGTEEIVLVAGDNVPVTSLSLESVQVIFSGDFSTWEQVPEAQGSSTEGNQLISTLSYPAGHELRTLFEKSFLNSNPIASNPTVFYSEEGIEELLKEDPLAIAYTLKSQVPPDFRTLNIISDKPQPGLQYVLAITPQEPEGLLRQLLLCLQDAP